MHIPKTFFIDLQVFLVAMSLLNIESDNLIFFILGSIYNPFDFLEYPKEEFSPYFSLYKVGI